jgi:hypothetical protein
MVYPRDHFPWSSEGLVGVFFSAIMLFGYSLVGALLGACGGLVRNRRGRVGLILGTGAGIAIGLGVIVILPGVLDRWHALTCGGDELDHGMVTIVVSLVCTAIGAVSGTIGGSCRADKATTRQVMNAWAEAELEKRERVRSRRDTREHLQGILTDRGRRPGSTQVSRKG